MEEQNFNFDESIEVTNDDLIDFEPEPLLSATISDNADDDFNVDDGEELVDELDQLIDEDSAAQEAPIQRQYRSSTNIADSTLYLDDQYEDIKAKEMRKHWEKFKQYRYNRTAIGGKVIGVERARDNSRVNIRVSINDDFTAIIPDTFFFTEGSFKANYYEAEIDEQLTRRLEKARHCEGAWVPFIIVSMTQEIVDGRVEYYIIGDRVSALKAKRDAYFKSNRRAPQVNDNTVAQVISVGEHFANLEVLGVECVVRAAEITAYRFVRDCRDVLKPGDTLNVSIRRININDDGSIKLRVSGATIDNRVIAANSLNLVPGSTYTGFVRSYNQEREMYTVITSNKASVAVPARAVVGYEILMLGDTVTTTVTHKSKNGVAYGTAMRR